MRKMILPIVFFTLFVCSAVSESSAAEYEALKHIKAVQAIFDFRAGDPKAAALQLDLIHDTYRDLTLMKKRPVFVVVFMGPSVKLITKKRNGSTPDDQVILNEIAATISAMSRNGIKFEICLVSAGAFKVDTSAVLPEVTRVGNGWISEIGYQTHGYSLVPVF
jgi:intracellular sulfur oxidation DsrE/DsrF family protein